MEDTTAELTPQQKVDKYIALRVQVAELAAQARELGKQFPFGRTESTLKDVRVTMTSGGVKHYRAKPSRKVMIVNKPKPKEKKSEQAGS